MVLKGMNSILCWMILSYPLRGCGWLSTVCDTVVLCVGTQCASPLEVLLDDSNNGCVSDPWPCILIDDLFQVLQRRWRSLWREGQLWTLSQVPVHQWNSWGSSVATLLNPYFTGPFCVAALLFYGQILSSSLFVLLFSHLVLWGIVRAATSLSVVHHLTTDLQSATLLPIRLLPLSS